MARHGQISICKHCQGTISYVVYSGPWDSEDDELDEWWAHEVHPQDNHDAEPIEEAYLNTESNLVRHALRELERVGYGSDVTDPLDRAVREQILKIVNIFATEVGHSGGSAPVTIEMIRRLLSFLPLTPLTDDPREWMDVAEYMGGQTVWQNRRDGRAFSEDGGKTYYLVDELPTGWRRRLKFRRKMYKTERTNDGC